MPAMCSKAGTVLRSKLHVGDLLIGDCGIFAPDQCGPKRIEGLGRDWIVCRTANGEILTALVDKPAKTLKAFRVKTLDQNAYSVPR
jgi:hypothetical protein